ncbi:transcription elongation factor A N-terminal and central domain-containing protein [Poeciliopsis prolifica]|uniref:transcription elongation factor A N-terminal and central domain-containing protein n=1 Tax=Poeciliopsis prolifica TaxID=188132 RepID=UPI002413DD07|nr:transcription elongation factor A N-terminal and central domain-containing protein [Poeciliopsis prolifica]XP_054881002.1 transcription elongation factor A N-terminal and central domain-containing protein [Poeciliopsis prolifica]
METEEVVHCALQLEKLAAEQSFGSISALLGDLERCDISAEQLGMTDLVEVLYKLLKTCRESSVRKTAKSLLSRWKRRYGSERRGDSGNSCAVSSEQAEDGGVSKDSAQMDGNKEDRASGQECETPTGETTSPSSDSVRTKCVQLLLAALRPEPPDGDKAAELAESIERHIHRLHKTKLLKYKACVRSKVANLRNPKNSHLRHGLLSGSLAPESFARMSAEEMANAELRQLREEYSSRGVSERQLPQGLEGTPTQKVRCKRCGGSDCRVTQVSRGALFLPAWVRRGGPDEDAMTFVTCSGCGQQWYHNGWVCL